MFADLSSTSEPYTNALCSQGVLAFGDPYLSRQWHDERGPCAWSLAVNGTEVAEFAAEFAAKRLAGGNADFAGGAHPGRAPAHRHARPEEPVVPGVGAGRPRAATPRSQRRCRQGPNYEYLLDLGQLSNQAVRTSSPA